MRPKTLVASTMSSRREKRDRAADDFLGRPRLVDVGGVPEGDAELDRLPEERLRLVLDERPLVRTRRRRVAVAHAAEREPADLQSGGAQSYGLHRVSPRGLLGSAPYSSSEERL